MEFGKDQIIHIPCQNKECNHEIKISFDEIQSKSTLEITCSKCNTSFNVNTKKIIKDLEEQITKDFKKHFTFTIG